MSNSVKGGDLRYRARVVLLISIAGILYACASPEIYEPEAADAFLIDDTDRAARESDAGESLVFALKLSEGTHKLQVRACEVSLPVRI